MTLSLHAKKFNLVLLLLLFGSVCFGQANSVDISTYDKAKPYLTVRIYSDASVAQKGGIGKMVSRVDLEGTTTVLMLDMPGGFSPLFKTDFEKWNKPADEVFKDALANVGSQKVEKVTKIFDGDIYKTEFNFLGNEDYAASYALNLQANGPELVGEWGSVIVIPNRGFAAICTISKAKPVDFVKFIQRIKPVTDKSFAEHEVPVSNGFYWYYKGKFTLIQVLTDDKGNINVVAPLGLGKLMSVKN
ncbi:hypothetical protein [Mucilaginibacter psychrotolerans]|uniref:Uncharacterized protein n=1 Tax=Mucilaginibacter psychrotolerans TaxID=1524096 RepID=A0A4Y8S5X4_9SPHI|nr:hypothetical protein [Mucilaginibacter psychrotolerans]TFF33804.1 hypothetical protein E2R66_24035 [Mucilaginibacter psychrotolerans]